MTSGIELQLTQDRVADALTAAGYIWDLDDDDDILMRSEHGAVWVVRRGDDWSAPYVYAQWRNRLPQHDLTDAILTCNTWNAEHFVPKAYAKRGSDSSVRLHGDQVLNMPNGCSDETLQSALAFVVGGSLEMLEFFSEIFPEE